jgi:hypothetical protein
MSARAEWLPSPEQEALLGAAIAIDAAEARRSWERWNALTALDRAGPVSFNLLPLVYRNLTNLGATGTDIDRLRGIYRYTWSRNQVLMRTGARAIETLERAGIATLVLKGAAVTIQQFGDLGVRPMVDFDLLVPQQRAYEAIEALLASPFEPDERFPRPEQRVPVHHSTEFVDVEGSPLDIHWYSLWQSAPDDDFWEAAVPIRVGGTESRTLCATDQLLHTCAHGTYWGWGGSLGWIADSAKLIRSEEDPIDWQRFCAGAEAHRIADSILAPLAYLRDRFELPIPEGTLAELRRQRSGLFNRLTRRLNSSPQNPVRVTLVLFDRYQRLKRLDPSAPRPPSFPAYLAQWFGYDSIVSFSLDAPRRLAGRRNREAEPAA